MFAAIYVTTLYRNDKNETYHFIDQTKQAIHQLTSKVHSSIYHTNRIMAHPVHVLLIHVV